MIADTRVRWGILGVARINQRLLGGQPDDPIGDQAATLLESPDRVFDREVEAVGKRRRIRDRWEQPLRGQHCPELRHRWSGVAAAQQLHSPSLHSGLDLDRPQWTPPELTTTAIERDGPLHLYGGYGHGWLNPPTVQDASSG